MSATGHGSRRCGVTTLPPTAAPLLGRRGAALWLGLPPLTMGRLADACGAFDGGWTACTLRGEVRRITRQRVEHVPPPRRRKDASAGGGAVAGRFDPLAAHRRVARDLADRARQGVGLSIFYGFNGRNTQTSGLPGLRPVAPSLRSGNASPPYGGRWRATRTVTRATLGTCSVLDRRPRSATSKAQAVPLAPPGCRPSRQESSGRLHGRDHP